MCVDAAAHEYAKIEYVTVRKRESVCVRMMADAKFIIVKRTCVAVVRVCVCVLFRPHIKSEIIFF